MKKNKKIGLFLLIGPPVILMTTLFLYAICTFLIQSTDVGSAGIGRVIISIINIILSLLGLACVFGIMVGVPLGIVFLSKKEFIDGAKYDERSGKKAASVVPGEIKGWNWGAAGLTWIWGIYHGVWISLLSFIPVVNVVIIILLGIKGSEWAWKAQKWESVESFKASQNKWKPWGIAIFILAVLILIARIVRLVVS